jgi:hypothetical protein
MLESDKIERSSCRSQECAQSAFGAVLIDPAGDRALLLLMDAAAL